MLEHPEELRVLVVDDDEDLRVLVRAALEVTGGFTIVGEAGEGGTALASAAMLRPDVVVLDLGLPDMSGLNVLTELRRVAPGSRVVIFSGLDDRGATTAALAGGASSYVLKTDDIGVLVRALRTGNPTALAVATLELAPDPESPAAARRFVADLCDEWGLADLVDVASLITSELVTNVVTHAQTSCTLTVQRTPVALRISATDTSQDALTLRDTNATSEGGRGLYILAALSSAWGVDAVDAGKTVWAELAVDVGAIGR